MRVLIALLLALFISPAFAAQYVIDVPDPATQAEAEAGTEKSKYMTPERTKQAIDALAPGGSGSSGRPLLTGDRTYYVRANGNDTNDCLTDTDAGACGTLKGALDKVAKLDVNGKNVTVQLQASTTFEHTALYALPTIVGSANTEDSLVIRGDPTMTNMPTIKGGTSGYVPAIYANSQTQSVWTINGVKMTSVGADNIALDGGPGSAAMRIKNIELGAVGSNHSHIFLRGNMYQRGDLKVTAGAAVSFLNCQTGWYSSAGKTVTSSGSLNWGKAFVYADYLCTANMHGMTFTGGSHTGRRYDVYRNSLVFTSGGGANYFPGSTAGRTQSGGLYE